MSRVPVAIDQSLVSVIEAARTFGYSSDYIARLCRTKKVKGELVGRAWYVDSQSLEEYIARTELEKRKRADELALERKQSYAVSAGHAASGTSSFACSASNREASVFADSRATARAALLSVCLVACMFLYVAVPNTWDATAELARTASTRALALADRFDTSALTARVAPMPPERQTETESVVVPAAAAQSGIGAQQNAEDGVATIPSSGDEALDAAALADIAESFSDEVSVVPNEDGATGVIKPVFKNQNDDEYLYVLVPVDKTPSAQKQERAP